MMISAVTQSQSCPIASRTAAIRQRAMMILLVRIRATKPDDVLGLSTVLRQNDIVQGFLIDVHIAPQLSGTVAPDALCRAQPSQRDAVREPEKHPIYSVDSMVDTCAVVVLNALHEFSCLFAVRGNDSPRMTPDIHASSAYLKNLPQSGAGRPTTYVLRLRRRS